MRLYTSKKEAKMIRAILYQKYLTNVMHPDGDKLLAVIDRIDLCLKLQESEEKAGVSDEIQK